MCTVLMGHGQTLEVYCMFVFVAQAPTKLGTVWSVNLVRIKFGRLIHTKNLADFNWAAVLRLYEPACVTSLRAHTKRTYAVRVRTSPVC